MKLLYALLVIALSASAPNPTGSAPVWTLAIGGRGSPVADDEMVYFMSVDRDVIAVRTSSGALAWKRAAGAGTGNTLRLAGDTVLVGAYDVVALDRRTGEPRWTFAPADGYGPGLFLGDVSRDLVYCGSPSGRLYAVEWATGHLRWSRTVREDGVSTVFAPMADEHGVLAGFSSFTAPNQGGAIAFDVNGREQWRLAFRPTNGDVPLGHGWAGGPVIAADLAIIADASGRISGIDRLSGRVKWTLPPIAANDVMDFRALASCGRAFVASSLSGAVLAFGLPDHRMLWRYENRKNGSAGFGVSCDARRAFVPFVGGLVALDLTTGAEVWRAGIELGDNSAPPLVTPSRVFAVGSTALVAYGENTEKQR